MSLGDRVVPIEIKSGLTVAPDAFDGLRYFDALAGQETGVLIHGGERSFAHDPFTVRPWWVG
jgi:hypothetical protein